MLTFLAQLTTVFPHLTIIALERQSKLIQPLKHLLFPKRQINNNPHMEGLHTSGLRTTNYAGELNFINEFTRWLNG